MSKKMVLVGGASGTGKSSSLFSLRNDKGVMYLNCDAGKALPFKTAFEQYVITDPYQIYEAFEAAETMPEIHTIVIDTLTFLMDMFEMQYVVNAADGRKAWGEYGNFYRKLMLEYVPASTKTIIVLAHVYMTLDELNNVMQIAVPIKGANAKQGVEAMFSTVISTKKMLVKDLEKYANPMLEITEEEKELGYKHVFQVKLTAKTVKERLRSPMGMWNATYINNDLKLVLDTLNEYYD